MEIDYKEQCSKLQARVSELSEDLKFANAKLEENHYLVGAIRERKIARQAAALRNLNRRVRVQRLQLRRLNELERGLRPDEWTALKAEFAHELEEDDWNLDG